MKTTFQIALLGLMLGFTVSVATAHTGAPDASYWTNGSQLTATDLNNTVAHLHNTFNAGITDSHISPTAGIQHSKLAKPGLVPKAIGYVTSVDGGAEIQEDLNVASVTRNGAGDYTVTLDYTPTDVRFMVNVDPIYNASKPTCWALNHTASTVAFNILCKDSGGSNLDSDFSFVVLDGD